MRRHPMKVAVVGAGIVGVCSAHALAADGHAVTVFERRATVAEETSFANAGVLAPGYVTPWAAPGMLAKLLRQSFTSARAVRLQPRWDPALWRWCWRWWRACDAARYRASRQALQALAQRSLALLRAWRAQHGLEYEQQQGYLQLLRGAAELAAVKPALAWLAEAGIAHRLVDAEEARRIEPALSDGTALEAAVHLPDDEVGNCRLFAWQLRQIAQASGVRFEFRSPVRAIEPRAGGITLQLGDTADGGDAPRFDAVVLAAGVDSRALLLPLGIDLPLQPVWGYSVTAPVADPLHAPRCGVMDERYKTAVTRLGTRIRVAGTAELGARAGRVNEAAVATLYQVLHDWFPSAAALRQATVWMGARPMLPDGPPLIGESRIAGLYLNLGHGSSGWALACGSAELLADRLAGRAARVDAGAFDPRREG
jgi:D-amino-acid dehydrogenase